ncbi:ATP-binding cassette domain-containing protein [Paenibacillus sp. JMULE4]|uniref:ATP-binding cassette domain-containing protein n=1 Tax=Paenibacillus sp. JMULE4 TaxID=2518342 RepID=UPI001C2CCC99|nr:ATP-binding cassette domain-containing protein [Paenibacillus sp. JMULE4]
MGVADDGVLISMTGITKEFPGVKALENVSLEVRKGEVLALVGENGAGKSTLIKILSGLYRKDSGEIRVRGKSVEIKMPDMLKNLGLVPYFKSRR